MCDTCNCIQTWEDDGGPPAQSSVNELMDKAMEEVAIQTGIPRIPSRILKGGHTPEYMNLVSRVRKIDPVTADWMLHEAPKRTDIDFEYTDNLSFCFLWKLTPQGHRYWLYIAQKLLEE